MSKDASQNGFAAVFSCWLYLVDLGRAPTIGAAPPELPTGCWPKLGMTDEVCCGHPYPAAEHQPSVPDLPQDLRGGAPQRVDQIQDRTFDVRNIAIDRLLDLMKRDSEGAPGGQHRARR